MDSKIKRLRVIGLLEGISFITLLFVAMPLKYIGGEPMAVKVVGMAHGILFLMFVAALADASFAKRWEYGFRTLAFISSLIPFGTFWLDRKLKNSQLIPVRG